MDSNLISAIAWVSKGYALRVPKEYEFDEEEIQEMKKDPLVSKK
jgi:periodic tryptophan protein 1